MAKFNYVAMDGQGKEKEGQLQAETEADAIKSLKDKGLFPTSISEAKDGGGKKAKKGSKGRKGKKGGGLGSITIGTAVIPQKGLCAFTRQLGPHCSTPVCHSCVDCGPWSASPRT